MLRADVRQFDVVRVEGRQPHTATDQIAVEAPLEIRLNGEPFSVSMRTPGNDGDLAVGFLLTEGVIRDAADLTRIDLDPSGIFVDARLAPSRVAALPGLLASRRQVTMNSSCGMCGRRTLESLDIDAAPLPVLWQVPCDIVHALPTRLRAVQAAFAATGGLHAAGLFTRDGELDAWAEDVGRHNAVDKLLGRMLLAGRLPLADSVLAVSGRTSFEIVQKGRIGGVPFVTAVSAPSSLAIDLATATGITLVGFARDGRFNVYAHPGRVRLDDDAPIFASKTPS